MSTKKTNNPRCGLCGKTQNLIKTECCGTGESGDLGIRGLEMRFNMEGKA